MFFTSLVVPTGTVDLVTRIFFDLPDEDANQFGSIIGAKEYKQQLQFDLNNYQ